MAIPDLHSALMQLQEVGAVAATPDQVTQLLAYCQLLTAWQARINLISPKTLDIMWGRHILDSAQLVAHVPRDAVHLTDIGSGAGFPALVLAILRPDLRVTCVESDTRKCAFLQTVSRELGLGVSVHNRRILDHDWGRVDVLTARALASLSDLLPFVRAARQANPSLSALFPKGGNWRDEVAAVPELSHMFHVKHVSSKTDPAACILLLSPN